MSVELAPLFRHDRTALGQIYNAWAEHYNKCETCQHEGWFDPDKTKLCTEGQKLFKHWDRSSLARRVDGKA